MEGLTQAEIECWELGLTAPRPAHGCVAMPQSLVAPSVSVHRHRPTRRRHEDHRARGALAGQLAPLPAPGETAHLVLHDAVPLSAVVWHLVDLTPPANLVVSTLGFSRAFVAELIDRLRNGRVLSASVVCSNYFRRSDPTEYADAAAALARWPVTLTDARTHAKIAVFGPFSLEGSANLRSCRSIENVAVSNDPALADFHRKWISELANTPKNT